MNYHRIWIIGSGPTAKLADFRAIPRNDVILGVNGTIEWAPRLDWWFTLDQNPLNIKRLKNPLPSVNYFAALPENIKLPSSVNRYIRLAVGGKDGTPKSQEPRGRNTADWWMWRWSATRTLCEVPGFIHTGNSMWGALQLAFQLGFKEIIFVGLDGSRSPRVEGGYPNSLMHLPQLFSSALNQLKWAGVSVYNTSHRSTVTCFPTITFKEAVKMAVKAA